MERRCRHGVAAAFELDGVLLGHSRRLCETEGPADGVPWLRRPAAAGFGLKELERTDWAVRMGVSRGDVSAGELVGIAVAEGVLWLQIGIGQAPPLGRIADCIAERYRVAHRTTSPR